MKVSYLNHFRINMLFLSRDVIPHPDSGMGPFIYISLRHFNVPSVHFVTIPFIFFTGPFACRTSYHLLHYHHSVSAASSCVYHKFFFLLSFLIFLS